MHEKIQLNSTEQDEQEQLENASVDPRQLFEMNLATLLEKYNLPEKEITSNKLPDSILDQLTHGYPQPSLPRIGEQELLSLKSQFDNDNSDIYYQLLSHWTMDDETLKIRLKEAHFDPNIVDTLEIDKDDSREEKLRKKFEFEQSRNEKTRRRNDENEDNNNNLATKEEDTALIEIMNKEFLHSNSKLFAKTDSNENEVELISDQLYKMGLNFLDLSSKNAKSMSKQNRVAAIFLTLASQLGHRQAQC